MSIYRAQPANLVLEDGHSILVGQTGWYPAPLMGRYCPNLCAAIPGATGALTQPRGAGTVNSGVSNSNGLAGATFSFDGSTNAYVDLGNGTFEAVNSSPFSISWIELIASGGPSFANLFGLKDRSGKVFQVARTDNASFNALVLGSRSTTPYRFASFPSLASSVGVIRHVIVTSPKTMSQVDATMVAYADGKSYVATIAGAPFGLTAATTNYIGWQGIAGAGNTWAGKIGNFRIWNRLLSGAEAEALQRDPWLGMARTRRAALAGAAGGGGPGPGSSGAHRWFLAA